jgi:hypothetical protein
VWDKLRYGALAAYVSLAALMGLDGPGMHYDEALFFNAAVHVVSSAGEPSFAHDPWSWFPFAGRTWPLMALPYAAPVRSYLAMIPFALFGANYYTARILTMLVGVFAIWALSVLVRDRFDARTAAVAAWILAIHPAYVLFTVYDRGGVAEWMLPFGLLCLALTQYLRAPGARTAFWLGLAMGFGVWSRANIAWLLGAAAIAAGRALLRIPPKHYAAAAAGGLLGAAPLLAFEIRSGWATFAFMRSVNVPEPFPELIASRLGMLAETLLSDPQTRAIWGGPPLPVWQSIFAAVVVLAAAVGTFRRGGAGRFCAVAAGLLALCPVISRLSVHPHHMIAVVPMAAVLIAVASAARWRYLFAISGVIYIACALWWNGTAAWQIRATGGVGLWSDAVDELTTYLVSGQKDRNPIATDWGFGNSLFVLSEGKVKAREVFWGPWNPEPAPEDVYLLHPDDLVVFPAAAKALRESLSSRKAAWRGVKIRQRTGGEYAELVQVGKIPTPKAQY